MPTQTTENYLKAIYFLDQQDDRISVTDLSREMGVSTPTVNNMIKKLKSRDWVSYQKYKPVRLTAKGRRVAASIVRKHRLTEMFLTKIMGFGWEEVHDIAEQMEHINSDAFFKRMDELLGHPTIDPHGSPIPDKSGKVVQKDYLTLSEVKENQIVRLCALADSSTELLVYLNHKNIKLGTKIKLEKVEPYDQSLIISYDDHADVMLSHEVASKLLIEPT